MFLLRQSPNFEYSLDKSIVVTKGTNKKYVFSTSDPNVFFALYFPTPVKEKIAILDLILSDNATFKVEKQSFTSKVETAGKQMATAALKKGSSLWNAGATWMKGKLDERKKKQEEAKVAKAAAEEESKKAYNQAPPPPPAAQPNLPPPP